MEADVAVVAGTYLLVVGYVCAHLTAKGDGSGGGAENRPFAAGPNP